MSPYLASPLVSPQWLADHLGSDGLVVVDATVLGGAMPGGASAGGGVAAGLTLYAHDRGDIPIAFQLLVYPMLDDRTPDRTDHDTRNVRVWTPRSNRFGWDSYIGPARGGPR